MTRWRLSIAMLTATLVLVAVRGRAEAAPAVVAPARVDIGQVPILMYHYISVNPHGLADPARSRLSVAPVEFDWQMAWLKVFGYTPMTLDDLAAARAGTIQLPARPVVLTFDDGYADFYEYAFPVLRRNDFHATVYIISGRVGQPGYMTWNQLRELNESGLVTIGAHSRTHPSLRRLPADRAWAEVAGSKADLEARLGVPVRHFAYPSGQFDQVTRLIAGAAGFVTAVTTRAGPTVPGDDPLTLPRVRVGGGESLAEFVGALEAPPRTRMAQRRPPDG